MKINSTVKYGNYSSYFLRDMLKIPGCKKEFIQYKFDHPNNLNMENISIILYYNEIVNESNEIDCICIFRIRDDEDELFYVFLNTNMYRGCSSCDSETEMNHIINYSDNLKAVIEFNVEENELDLQLKMLLLHENFIVTDELSREIKHLLLFDQLFSLIGENIFFYSKIEHSTIYDDLEEYFSNISNENTLLNENLTDKTAIKKYYKTTKSEIIIKFISDCKENVWKNKECKILNFENEKFNFSYEGWDLLCQDYEKFNFEITDEKSLIIKIPCLVVEKR